MADIEMLEMPLDGDYNTYSDADMPPSATQKVLSWAENKDNILSHIEENVKSDIYNQVQQQYTYDFESMNKWLRKYDDALKVAAMTKASERKSTPFDGASQAMTPILMESAIDFSSRLLLEVLGKSEPAGFKLWGKETPEKEEQADRAKTFINYELMHDTAWQDCTDKEGIVLAIVGTTFKKVYHDAATDKSISRFVRPDKVVFSHDCERFVDAPQVTQDCIVYSKNDVIGNINAGVWDLDLTLLDDEATEFYGKEYHFWYDLDGDGFCEPYIAVALDDIQGLVSMYTAFDADDVQTHNDKITNINRIRYFSQKQFLPDPECSCMGLGWGILFSDIFKSINTNLRQLIDAGTIANNSMNSGLVSSSLSPAIGGARQQGAPINVKMGKLTRVQTSGASSLRDSVVQLPFQGANVVLFQLLQHLEESVRRTTTAAYNVQANPNEAASLYLARLQQSLKTPNAIMMRIFRGFADEFSLLSRCIYSYGSDDYYNVVLDEGEKYSLKKDFDPETCNIVPTADLSHGSDVERMARSSALLETSLNPALNGVANSRAAYAEYVESVGAEPEQLVLPPPQGMSPMEQASVAQQQMMAEFMNRDMMLKEQKLAYEQQKLMMQAAKDAADLELHAEKTQADIDLTNAKTARELAEIAEKDFNRQMAILDQFKQRFEESATNAAIEGRSPNVATEPHNERLYQ